MPGLDTEKPDICFQFRQAAKAACQPKTETNLDSHASHNLSACGSTNKVDSQWSDQNGNTKSSTQVAPLVRPPVVRPKACGLKPKRKRPYRLMGRYSKEERDTVIAKADDACMSVNEFIRISTLDDEHIPPLNPELRQRFIAVQRELCKQGADLNRIATYMETNALSPNEVNSMLGMIGWSLVAAHRSIKEAIAFGLEMPED